jgi:pimeloyl-ACP methyl ester carboxylesterase
MVLLHGFTNDWRCWTPLLAGLEARHAVFAPTMAGHLGADPFPDGEPPSHAAMADAVERQMDARGIEKAHFVGNSQGGWLSLELAARGRALSVVGLCPAGGWERGSAEERAVARSFLRVKWALRLSRPWFETIARRPRMRAIAFNEMVARPSRLSASGALAMLEAAAGCSIVDVMLATIEHSDVFGELGPIDCPVTIATASKDRLFNRPGHYVRLRRLLPEANWVVLDGLGHIPMSDDPDLVVELILSATSAAES